MPFDRPSLELFNQHCSELFQEIELEKCWIQGKATGLKKESEGWKIQLISGKEIKSKNVVLAMGLSEQPHIPEWAQQARERGGQIFHIFEKNIPNLHTISQPIVIIGGGISAAHTSLKLSRLFPGRVTLITRHSLRVRQFDADPGWLGPKYMSGFSQIKDHSERRKVIQEARYRGSMPKELFNALMRSIKKGNLSLIQDEVLHTKVKQEYLILSLASKIQLEARTILLTTGFHPKVPGIEWLKNTIDHLELPCADCGYPIVSPETLEWAPHLYVIGALAELEIGPVSRNIAGARRGAERILKAP